MAAERNASALFSPLTDSTPQTSEFRVMFLPVNVMRARMPERAWNVVVQQSRREW